MVTGIMGKLFKVGVDDGIIPEEMCSSIETALLSKYLNFLFY